jgi:predicted nuclease of predicted toxin-antitoxin system
MHRADDTQILEFARNDLGVCVTLDHDFHGHLAATGYGRPLVGLLRVQGLDAMGERNCLELSIYDGKPHLPRGRQSRRR